MSVICKCSCMEHQEGGCFCDCPHHPVTGMQVAIKRTDGSTVRGEVIGIFEQFTNEHDCPHCVCERAPSEFNGHLMVKLTYKIDGKGNPIIELVDDDDLDQQISL